MKFNKTYLILFLGMTLWGLLPLFTHKYVMTIDPLFLVSISTITASIPFFILLLAGKQIRNFFSINFLKDIFWVATLTAIGQGLLFIGTKLTSGTNTGLLLQSEPIYSLILGAIFLGEIISGGQILATLFMVLGAMAIVYRGGSSLNLGDIFILLSPLMFQMSHLMGKKLLNRKISVNMILAGRQFFGGLILVFFTLITSKSTVVFNIHNFGVGLYLGMLTAIVALCWYSSIKKIPVSTASSFLPLTALVSLLGSVFFLKEIVGIQQYIGFFLIVGGMIWQANLHVHKVLTS